MSVCVYVVHGCCGGALWSATSNALAGVIVMVRRRVLVILWVCRVEMLCSGITFKVGQGGKLLFVRGPTAMYRLEWEPTMPFCVMS